MFDERVIQLILTIWYRFSLYKSFTTTSNLTQLQGRDCCWWRKKTHTHKHPTLHWYFN